MTEYIFPDFLARIMAKVDLRTQYESTMLSMSFMMVGLVVTIIYLIIYFDLALWYKIFLAFNGLAGLLFFSSALVTTFNQYQTLMAAIKFQKEMKGGESNGKKRSL